MDTNDAHRLARKLMNEHGLYDWAFQFDNAIVRFGLCQHSKRNISLSRKLTELNEESEVRDVILHEIAHALVGFKAGHGPVWQRKALSIGCNASRTHGAKLPNQKWTVTCPNCGKKSQRSRKNKAPTACGKCCIAYNGGEFDARFTLIWVDNARTRV